MMWKFVLFAWAAGAATPTTDFYGDRFAVWVPSDVRAFVTKAQTCNHFAGEEGYDADRRAFLNKMMAKSCPKLDKRKAELARRYRRSFKIRKVILEAWSE